MNAARCLIRCLIRDTHILYQESHSGHQIEWDIHLLVKNGSNGTSRSLLGIKNLDHLRRTP